MSADTAWLQQENPRSFDEADVWAYFGIPPAAPGDLDAQIKKKRQFWTKRANGPANRETAARIKSMIQQLSKVLKEGAVPEGIVPTEDGGFKVLGQPTTPQELAEQLEQFLRQGQYEQVLRIARHGLKTWPDDIDVLISIDLALSDIFAELRRLHPDGAQLAVQISEDVLRRVPNNADAWMCMSRILLGQERISEVVELEQRASAQQIRLPAEVYLIVAQALFAMQDVDGAVRRLVTAVKVSGGDPGVRSLATDQMITSLLVPLLPLGSAREAKAWAEYVDVAAWLASGVPESEADLVEFRVWATQALAPVFVGDATTKSFLGVLTGFLALPIYGRLSSRPGWRVLKDGPFRESSMVQWSEMTGSGLVRMLHQQSPRRFDWEATTNGQWPTLQQSVQYVQANPQKKR